MTDRVTLHGYRFSVYHRIARVALEEKGVAYDMVEVNPFVPTPDEGPHDGPHIGPHDFRRLHPFGRVPVLCHGGFTIFETSAILRYIDGGFDGPVLTPATPQAAARMAQVVAIIDNYGYWPMVRQVFAHRVFRPLEGETPSEPEISAGLCASRHVLAALEDIAAEGLVLNNHGPTLADCHLGPVMDYFTAAEEGAEMLGEYPTLQEWWAIFAGRVSMLQTEPGRPSVGNW